MAVHMGSADADIKYDPGALSRLVAKGAGGTAVPLQVSKVDSLAKCAQVDPSTHVGKEVQDKLLDPGRSVGPNSHDLPTACRFGGGSRGEYIGLIRAQCRASKVVFSTSCKHAASVFTVAKPDGRQREVWHGTAFSEAC